MKIFINLLILSLVLVSCKPESPKEVEMISPQEMQDLRNMDDVQLVDIRTPEEYKDGYIAGFQNIDYFSNSFEQDIQGLDKSKPVVVYCRSGRRTAKCTKKMIEAGFVKIYDLEGGITQWQHEGFEVKTIEIP
ncbi:MAG: rhodanese-like domain-containing protein [Flavobacteriaceae bacterium]|nr:rhodanese-like domain-containing protein [Flavobacteriaceae bacterium]NNL79120.1 rhodanese-like domain-containing protein [Flavobacteriaceae bacterium]